MNHRLSVLFVLLLFCLPFGCGGSSSEAPLGAGQAQNANLRSTGGVQGFVFQVNPVFIVDDPAFAPPGSSPRQGALIRILDRDGNVIAEGTTDAGGRFEIQGLPPGRITVEARVNPTSVSADVTRTVTLIPDVVVPLGRSYPVNRAQATSLALQGVPSSARVLGSLQPFSPGTSVAPFNDVEEGPGSAARTIQAEEWFFFVDLQPDRMYRHPVQFVFVNAQTGQVTRIDGLEWFPRVNGFPLWSGPLQFTDGVTPGPEVVQQSTIANARRVPPSPRVLSQQAQGNDGTFAVVLFGYQDHPGFIADKKLVDQFYSGRLPAGQVFSVSAEGRTLDVVKRDLEAAFRTANNAIAKREEQGLESTLIFHFGSHGGTVKSLESGSVRIRATSSLNTSDTYRGRLSSNNDAVVASAECLDLSPVRYPETDTEDVFKHIGTNPSALGLIEFETCQTVRVLGLDRLGLTKTRACKVRVILDSCYSGVLANDIFTKAFAGTRHDLVVIGSSVELGIIDRFGCRFTQAAYIRADIENGDLTGIFGQDGKLLPVLQEFGRETDPQNVQKSVLLRRPGTGPCIAGTDPSPSPSPTPTSTPVDLIDAAGAQGPLSVTHVVGVSPCPQLVGTVAINRVTSSDVRITVSVPPGTALFVEQPASFNLTGSGIQLATRDIFFDCSTVNSFSTVVTVTATRLSDGVQEVVEVPVTVNIQ